MLPAHADDLRACCDAAFCLLERGVSDRRSPWHTPVLGTTGTDGAPALRTVVLRGFDPPGRLLRVHSDARSAKMAEITGHPRVSVLGYDPEARIQIRLSGLATLHAHDGLADQAWAEAQPQSRLCYAVNPGPGTTVPAPLPAPTAEAGGRAYFTVIQVRFDCLEWLWLASAGHRRARFTWRDGALAATWLVP